MDMSQLQQFVSKVAGAQRKIQAQLAEVMAEYKAYRKACEAIPRSITQEIDSIPGRRIFYNLTGVQTFTTTQNGNRGNAIAFDVSQDGPFVMTHYPLAVWRPSAPSNATNFGRWRPVSDWPLPDQVLDTDIINLSYELVDAGSQRNFQNAASGAGPFSRPDNFVPLPVPTLFAPNSTIQFYPTYEDILFSSTPATPTTAGVLAVALPGYRIVNM